MNNLWIKFLTFTVRELLDLSCSPPSVVSIIREINCVVRRGEAVKR